jgi:2-keto-4-pentenoate hydratase/2-oxohepta-3-ene-1,7-dioic acid hydratase in catechol pathway
LGKSKSLFDGSAKVGDFIPLSNFDEKEGIPFHLVKNGEPVQRGNSQEMLFSMNRVVAEVSRYFTLKAGDFIFTEHLPE